MLSLSPRAAADTTASSIIVDQLISVLIEEEQLPSRYGRHILPARLGGEDGPNDHSPKTSEHGDTDAEGSIEVNVPTVTSSFGEIVANIANGRGTDNSLVHEDVPNDRPLINLNAVNHPSKDALMDKTLGPNAVDTDKLGGSKRKATEDTHPPGSDQGELEAGVKADLSVKKTKAI